MKCLELDVVLRLLSEAQGVGSTESRVWLSRAQGWSAAAEMWPTCVRRRRRKVGAQPPRCGRHASAGGGARLRCGPRGRRAWGAAVPEANSLQGSPTLRRLARDGDCGCPVRDAAAGAYPMQLFGHRQEW
jgi:hypothetical protein